jgi:hypothetical protein
MKSDLMEQHTFKNVNSCFNTNIYSYLETSGGQSYNPYLNVVPFLTPELIRNLWQLKTAVFLHWCLNTHCSIPSTKNDKLKKKFYSLKGFQNLQVKK